jgi:hypothetical protein
MSHILEDQQVLRFDYLGDILLQITISGCSVSIETLLGRVFQTCCAQFVLVLDE